MAEAFIPSAIPFTQNQGSKSNISKKPKTIVAENDGQSEKKNRSRMHESHKPQTQTQRNNNKTDIKTKTQTMRNKDNKYSKIASDLTEKDDDKKRPRASHQRTYGIDSSSNKPVKINFPRNTTLFTTPKDPGGYKETISPTEVLSTQKSRLAVNVVDFDPTGMVPNGVNSIARNQFILEYRNILSRVSVATNASAYTKFTLDNFKVYIRQLTKLIDTWYEIDNLLAWAPDTIYSVEALREIRNFLNYPLLTTAKDNARSFMANLWFPTQILKIIEWKNQTYRASNLPTSAVMRLASYEMTDAINKLDVSILIDKLNNLQNSLSAAQDDENGLTVFTVATLNGLLFSKINDSCILNRNLPLSCNTSVYDPDFIEYFTNSSVIYGANKIYPLVPDGGERPLATYQAEKEICEATLAFQGIWSGSENQETGLFKERSYTLSDGNGTNKLIADYNASTSVYSMKSRNKVEWNITNDVNFVHDDGNCTRKITMPPCGAHFLYVDAESNTNVAVKKIVEMMYEV